MSLGKCLQQHAKASDIAVATIKECLKEELLEELSIRFVGDVINPKAKSDYLDDVAMYELYGYLVHARPSLTNCQDCKKSIVADELHLPDDFLAADLTKMRSKGFLTFVTIPMFKTIREIEGVIKWHFNNPEHFYVLDTFQHCITKICNLHLIPIFCEQHGEALIPYMVMKYTKIRHHFEAKRLNNLLLSKQKAKVKAKFKEGKLA